MATSLFIATTLGLFIATQNNGHWTVIGQALNDQPLTTLATSGEVILAGSTKGIWRSTDKGKTWMAASTGLKIPYVRWLATASTPHGLVLAGTEPAGIFVSTDAGRSWNCDPGILKLRDANGWFLPYSPRAGCVRGFAVAESGPNRGRIYAAVEVGGVLITDDNGRSWQLAAGSDGKPDMNRHLGEMVHPDVHSITVHPSSSDIVTAATGGGLFRSSDGGRSWKNIYPCYIRAIWVDPGDHQHLVAGPADGVSRNGRIEESRDGGRSWQPAFDGMDAPWARHMVERFAQVDDQLFAVLSNGELWAKKLSGTKWGRVLPEIAQVKAVAANR
jgi:photosystem II stability/assembly factor-like uncharacterized protein